eukprot:365963-Chlamydomonas_euryale.AAC.9
MQREGRGRRGGKGEEGGGRMPHPVHVHAVAVRIAATPADTQSYARTCTFHTAWHMCVHTPPGTCAFTLHLAGVRSHSTWHMCVHTPPGTCAFTLHLAHVRSHSTWHMCAHTNSQVEFGSSTFTYFLAAFYNTFVLMIGNNIDPGNSWEQALCCFVTLGGAAFYSIILGSISLLVSNMDPGATRHRLKRDIIHNTMRYLGVNKELVNK